MKQIRFVLLFLALCSLGLVSGAPIEPMSTFLRKMLGNKAIKSGNIPAYSTTNAHVTRSNTKSKRDTGDSDTMYYTIQTEDEVMNVELHPNKKLLSKYFIVQKRMGDGSLQTMNNTARNCFYTGIVTNHRFSRVAISMCKGEMEGMIEAGDNVYLLEPQKGRKDHSHVAYKMKRFNMTFENSGGLSCPILDEVANGQTKYFQSHVVHKCNRGFQLFGSTIQRCLPTGTWSGNAPVCIRKGTLKGDGLHVLQCPDLPNPEWGTVNIIQSKSGLFIAVHECMAEHTLVGSRLRFCVPTTGNWSGSAPTCLPSMNGGNETEEGSRKRRQATSGSNMEVMVYIDEGVESDINANGFDVGEYILAIINIMASLYREPTLEHQIDLTLTRIIIGEASDFSIVQSASTTLNNFCDYQQSINPTSDSDPMHHDHAILITSADICGSSCSTIGFAPISGMCSQRRSCTINEDSGFSTAFTLAHETGHNLGMQHDGTGNACGGSSRIMAPSVGGQAENFLWSTCSAQYLQSFLSSGFATCLDDVPINTDFNVNPTELVGLTFSADDQCRSEYGPNAVFCPFSFGIQEVCQRLWCQPNGGSCTTRNVPAADGTNCGSSNEFRVCSKGQCVDGNTIINAQPVDGGWSAFGSFTTCTRTCGGGLRYRERQCNNPPPQFGGSFCVGESREYDALCNTDPCPAGSPSFIDQQCAATNDMPFNGVLYSWEEFDGRVTGVTPCQLVCAALGTDPVLLAIRASVAEDGTPCTNSDSSTGVCAAGICTPVGCDNVLNSEAVPDSCGVCNGDNSGSSVETETITGSGGFGYHTVFVIPTGARNVRVAETVSTSSIYLAFISGSGQQQQYILNGGLRVFSSRTFTAVGNVWQYVRTSAEESLFTSGPLQEPLTVQALVAVSSASYSISIEYNLCN